MPVKPKATKEDPGNDPGEGTLPITVDDIRAIFELMKDNDVGELELEQGGVRIHVVSKQQPVHYAMAPAPLMMQAAPPPAAALGDSAPAAPQAGAPKEDTAPANVKTIKSPMVGTFYRAASPDSDPFVRTGDSVTEDSVLCIIEAMKLFNEIKAECRGRIYKVLAENGQPVEYNQPLFLVEPD